MSETSAFDAIVFDIGDVLFTWSSHTNTSVPSKTLRQILTSPTWSDLDILERCWPLNFIFRFDYERGKLAEDICYERVGAEFSLAPEEIRQAFIEARASLKSNDDLINLIRDLKEQSNGTLRVFAMSNISLPDYQVLRTKEADWGLFDAVFTSGEVGERT